MDIGACKTCKFFASMGKRVDNMTSLVRGECRAHAPVFHPSHKAVGYEGGIDPRGYFPEISDGDWCGDYQYNLHMED